ncbi:ComF family protein [Paenibacillus sp. sgz500958]|uniref:ComF family protein n=1 Tax=Paenibacillus sp. sgz500958 TaxID=3242475 RepID=UPI0036D28B39
MSNLNTWRRALHALLAPSLISCLSCGRKAAPSKNLPAICTMCAESIPWIDKPRCRHCGRHIGCPDCTRSSNSPSPIQCNRSAVVYDSLMRDWLGRYKYRGNERFADVFGVMMDRAYLLMKDELQRDENGVTAGSSRSNNGNPGSLGPRRISSHAWNADLLVSVPVSDSRLNERGFNQAERLAASLSKRRGIPQLPLLIRTHHTGKQSFKSRAERLADMKDAFAPNPMMYRVYSEWLEQQTAPLRVIIVDDIYTTGSTIRACGEAVTRMTEMCGKGAKVFSLTLARS